MVTQPTPQLLQYTPHFRTIDNKSSPPPTVVSTTSRVSKCPLTTTEVTPEQVSSKLSDTHSLNSPTTNDSSTWIQVSHERLGQKAQSLSNVIISVTTHFKFAYITPNLPPLNITFKSLLLDRLVDHPLQMLVVKIVTLSNYVESQLPIPLIRVCNTSCWQESSLLPLQLQAHVPTD